MTHKPQLSLTWLSNPIVSNIKKNKMAHSVDTGICAMPAGYTMNTNPGPIKQPNDKFRPEQATSRSH